MKSQASFEFLVLVIVVLLFMLFTFSSAASTQLSAQQDETQSKLNNICNDISDKINKAVYYGNGFNQNSTLPLDIFGTSYRVNVINNKTLSCSTNTSVITSSVQTFTQTQIQNSLGQFPFEIQHTSISISNANGVVVISP